MSSNTPFDAAYDAAVPEFRSETLLTESEQQGKPGPLSGRTSLPAVGRLLGVTPLWVPTLVVCMKTDGLASQMA